MRKIAILLLTLATLLLALAACCLGPADYTYPSAAIIQHYPIAHRGPDSDTFHNTTIPDPYRWLENPDSPESQAWAAAQNRLTQNYIAGPARDRIKSQITAISNYAKYSAPDHIGDRYFFDRNTGLQNQSVLYRINHLGDTPQLVFDPNTLSADGTIALESFSFSFDGTLLAYGLSVSGSDRQEIHILNTDTSKNLPDVIRFTKFTAVAWKHDNSGFFYNRFPEPGTVPPDDENNFCKMYYHQLGTPQSADTLILERPDDKTLHLFPIITDDGKYLLINIVQGTAPENRLWVRPVESPPGAPFQKLFDAADAYYGPIDNVGTTFYILTNKDAPRGKIISLDVAHPDQTKIITPEGPDAITGVGVANHQFILSYLHDASSLLKIINLDGSRDRDLPMPPFGSIGMGASRLTYTELFLTFSSYASPMTIYRYDFSTHQLSLYHKSEIKTDLSAFETRQVFVTSKDGTRVPLFITCAKTYKPDPAAPAPVMLMGYGAYDVNETPGFDIPYALWLQHGGIFCDAVIRGGGEYGESWHQAGMLKNKQHGFDDFQACAQFLIDNHYTVREKLAIDGASNGGLLTLACMLQRPDLYGAVLAEVPITDMLRYTKFAAGVGWIPEFGDPQESPEMFQALRAYSPLHNIKPGVNYPPLLVTTADSDDRVDPSHAKKFVATMQATQQANGPETSANPVLLRIETKAGHGDGKPTEKIIGEEADLYAFLFRALHME